VDLLSQINTNQLKNKHIFFLRVSPRLAWVWSEVSHASHVVLRLLIEDSIQGFDEKGCHVSTGSTLLGMGWLTVVVTLKIYEWNWKQGWFAMQWFQVILASWFSRR
jgi:hypothetical protein